MSAYLIKTNPLPMLACLSPDGVGCNTSTQSDIKSCVQFLLNFLVLHLSRGCYLASSLKTFCHFRKATGYPRVSGVPHIPQLGGSLLLPAIKFSQDKAKRNTRVARIIVCITYSYHFLLPLYFFQEIGFLLCHFLFLPVL